MVISALKKIYIYRKIQKYFLRRNILWCTKTYTFVAAHYIFIHPKCVTNKQDFFKGSLDSNLAWKWLQLRPKQWMFRIKFFTKEVGNTSTLRFQRALWHIFLLFFYTCLKCHIHLYSSMVIWSLTMAMMDILAFKIGKKNHSNQQKLSIVVMNQLPIVFHTMEQQCSKGFWTSCSKESLALVHCSWNTFSE